MKQGWEVKKLAEVAGLKGRIGWKGLTAKEYVESGPLFLSVHSLNYGHFVDFCDAFHITNERYDESPEIMLKKGDILICKDGAGIGKLGMVGELPDKTTVNSSLLVIRGSVDIMTKYLYFSLLSPFFQKIVQDRLQGATTPHLYQRDIATFPVYLPPLAEQEAIVEILDKAFASIDQAKANIEQNIANAKELFQSKLNQIFSQKGDGWVIKPLDQISTIINGYSFKSGDFSSSLGVKSIKITNVGVQEFVEDDSNNLPASFSDEHRSVCVHSGNLVLALTRTIISSGLKVAIIPETYDGALLNQRVAAIIPNKGVIDRHYLYYYFSSTIVSNYVLKNVNALMQPNLSIKNLKLMPIPICSMEEQQSMRSIIEKLDERATSCLEAYQTKLTSLDELKKSILQKAFAGQLT